MEYRILSICAVLGIILFSYVYAETLTLDFDGDSVTINYSPFGLDVVQSTDDGSETIILDVVVYGNDSSMVIELPRYFIDAKNGDDDIDYFIIFDGFSLGSYTEESNDEIRTLTFSVPNGVDMIEIVGTEISKSMIHCDSGMMLVDGTCQLENTCAQGTILVDGTCQLENTCAQGTILVDDTCQLENTCAQGTILVDDTCQLENTCAQGTILVDDTCQLENTCAQGTILVDGVCELNTRTSNQKSLGFELIYGIVFAFIISFILLIIMWIVKHAHKTS